MNPLPFIPLISSQMSTQFKQKYVYFCLLCSLPDRMELRHRKHHDHLSQPVWLYHQTKTTTTRRFYYNSVAFCRGGGCGSWAGWLVEAWSSSSSMEWLLQWWQRTHAVRHRRWWWWRWWWCFEKTILFSSTEKEQLSHKHSLRLGQQEILLVWKGRRRWDWCECV